MIYNPAILDLYHFLCSQASYLTLPNDEAVLVQVDDIVQNLLNDLPRNGFARKTYSLIANQQNAK